MDCELEFEVILPGYRHPKVRCLLVVHLTTEAEEYR